MEVNNVVVKNVAIKIIEIKARQNDPTRVRDYLKSNGALHKGTDHQIDTYFVVESGRLKLREGSIENSLIFYNRPTQEGPKRSDVVLSRPADPAELKAVLVAALPVKVVVDKVREIYFIDNVKFHIDDVKDLGRFIEIEAIDDADEKSEAELLDQCRFYMVEMGIQENDLVSNSYSDLLLSAG